MSIIRQKYVDLKFYHAFPNSLVIPDKYFSPCSIFLLLKTSKTEMLLTLKGESHKVLFEFPKHAEILISLKENVLKRIGISRRGSCNGEFGDMLCTRS